VLSNLFFEKIEITPNEMPAGDSAEITIRLVVGIRFSAENSCLVLDMPGFLGFNRPSVIGPEDVGYTEVLCSNPDIVYEKHVWNMETEEFVTTRLPRFQNNASRMFVVLFQGGDAQAGDEIIIKWGYVRDGYGTGVKVTTLSLTKPFYSMIDVRYFVDQGKAIPDYGRSYEGYDRPTPDFIHELQLRITPREPERMRLVRTVTGSRLQIMDRFANISDVADLSQYVEQSGEMRLNRHGVFESDHPDLLLASKGLPLAETPAAVNVIDGYHIFYGDIHCHSSLSNDCIEREKMNMTPDRMFAYGKEAACLDFMAITDHHQPWDVERNKLTRADWTELNEAVRKYSEEGLFVAFWGFEFRCERGDTHVLLNEELDYDMVSNPNIQNIKDLWEAFKGIDYMAIPHFHNSGKLDTGIWYACPYEGVEPVIEFFSCHGSFEFKQVQEKLVPAHMYKLRDDRTANYFLSQGLKYGLTCNSDGHKGNPGRNGLTAVFAKELTRDAILDAYRNRRVYGTTNARIRLVFMMNGQLMGSVLPAEAQKTLKISVAGEQPFKAIDIVRNGELYRRFKPNSVKFEEELMVEGGKKEYWYIRVVQTDNHMALSSPIWCG
jgi:hypothetical protein